MHSAARLPNARPEAISTDRLGTDRYVPERNATRSDDLYPYHTTEISIARDEQMSGAEHS